MKTIEFKILPSKSQQDYLIKNNAPDLAWAWNLALELLIENHTINYYEWLVKKASEQNISLDGIDLCYLRLSKKSGWSLPMMLEKKRIDDLLTSWKKEQTYKYFSLGGHSCQIAYIDKSGKYIPVEKKPLPTEARLIAHLKPGKRMGSSPSSIYITLSGCLTIEKCNKIREERGLPKLTLNSSYLKGLLNRLATSWAAYIDTKRRDSHIPKFKKDPVSSFSCISPADIKLRNNQLILPGLTDGIRFVNNNHSRIKDGSDIRSAVIKKEPSGWYVCLTVAPPLEVELRKIRDTKKEDRTPELEQQINQLETALSIHEKHEAGIRKSNKAVGIDPGIKALVATDKGTLIAPNAKVEKREKRIQRLQRKLSRQKKHGKNFKKTSHLLAKQHEVNRRSRAAYQHKISTYLVRTFGAIAWEETQLNNINKKPKAKLRDDGSYAQNGAKRKAGLNRALANAGMGGLREKTKSKMTTLRGKDTFILTKPHYSSRMCHSCGVEGERPSQTDFYCKNPKCKLFGIKQQADVNAARNHLLNSSFLTTGEYRLWDWYEAHQENTSLRSGKFKPEGETLFSGDSPLSETEHKISRSMKQEAGAMPASSAEYADQLPKPHKGNKARKGGCKKPKSAKTTSKLDTASTPNLDNLSPIREPYAASIPANSPTTSKSGIKKKRRPAQSSAETFTQLTIWDIGGEISFE